MHGSQVISSPVTYGICTIQMKLYAEDILWSCELLEMVIVVFICFMEIISEEDLANIESLNNTLDKISDMLNKII